MTKKELAISLHDRKYNCAQAVACAFAEEFGIERETLFQVCEGFGLGMGGMNGTCGAISGAVILAGLKNSDGNTEKPGTKASTYQLSKTILEKFEERNHGTRCRDLKGVDTGNVLRSCPGCIEDAVEIVQEVLLDKQTD
ncbi:MAG: C-GCAxxG-C-C family protein [Fusicatenibacter sp.]